MSRGHSLGSRVTEAAACQEIAHQLSAPLGATFCRQRRRDSLSARVAGVIAGAREVFPAYPDAAESLHLQQLADVCETCRAGR